MVSDNLGGPEIDPGVVASRAMAEQARESNLNNRPILNETKSQ